MYKKTGYLQGIRIKQIKIYCTEMAKKVDFEVDYFNPSYYYIDRQYIA